MKKDSAAASDRELARMLCVMLRSESWQWPLDDSAQFRESFLQAAQNHGVEALLCYLLKPTDRWNALPVQVQGSLLQALRSQAAAEMVRTADLLALLEKLRAADLSVLLLKGAALAYTCYPLPGLRPRCDTDLFFHYNNIEKIQRLFCELGYQCKGPAYKSHQFTCSKVSGGLRTAYDVHWRVNNSPRFARAIRHEEGMRQPVLIPELADCPALNPELALLTACLHRSANPNHDADRLIWLYDIHLLISGMSEAALVQFAHKAVAENIQQACLSALQKTQCCLATKMPERVFTILAAPERKSSWSASYFSLIADDLRCLPDAGSRLALLRELLLPPSDELFRKYGESEKKCRLPWLHARYLAGGLLKRIFFLR